MSLILKDRPICQFSSMLLTNILLIGIHEIIPVLHPRMYYKQKLHSAVLRNTTTRVDTCYFKE